MKIAVTSDVHLEFGPLTLTNDDGADVLILGGDVCVAADLREPDPYNIMNTRHSERLAELLDSASKNFKHVILIMGNHEHYHGDYARSADIIRKFVESWSNVYFLDKEVRDIEGVRFFGGTLWTDFNLGNGPGDQRAMRTIGGMMNDYRGVKHSGRQVSFKENVPVYDESGDFKRDDAGNFVYQAKFGERDAKFSPEDGYEDHLQFMSKLQAVLDDTPAGMKVVVVGHHAPSKASTHPRYRHETMMNTAYSSDLTEFMLDNSNIKLWTHGHTHEDFDYMVGSTRVFCNPRGYDGYEERADRFKLKSVEI
jgi:Icc-related predicted phosphoesterase